MLNGITNEINFISDAKQKELRALQEKEFAERQAQMERQRGAEIEHAMRENQVQFERKLAEMQREMQEHHERILDQRLKDARNARPVAPIVRVVHKPRPICSVM